MFSNEWLENLANSYLNAGQLYAKNPLKTSYDGQQRYKLIIHELGTQLHEACYIHNKFASSERQISLLPLTFAPPRPSSGYLLLLGGFQIQVNITDSKILITLVEIINYEHKKRLFSVLTPNIDPLGAVIWRTAQGENLTLESVIKFILGELTKTYLKKLAYTNYVK